MADEALQLNALVLRALADSASSRRLPGGEPGFMVTTFDPEKGWSTRFEPKAPPPAEAEVVTPVNTAEVARARRPAVKSVTILAEGMTKPQELALEYDALFWSEAAVEKFVIPYYASKSKWMAAHLLERLSTLFYGYVPQATPENTILPIPPGAASPAPQGTPAEPAGPFAGEGVPFALAHLPRSDYVGLEEAATVGADLGVLLVKDGVVVLRRLSDYL